MGLFSLWMLGLVAGRLMLNRVRQCVVGRCVSEIDGAKTRFLNLSDLEISKPQRNTKSKQDTQSNGARRRSRSPDYTRGGTAPIIRDGRYGNVPNSMSPRDRDRRFRERDDYRPMRSPSPRGGRGLRSRDRSRDRYDSRYRSRSRTPPRRHRSPSPGRGYTEDGLDLPRRLPHEVPDIQILVLNESLPGYVVNRPAATSGYNECVQRKTNRFQGFHPLRRRRFSITELTM